MKMSKREQLCWTGPIVLVSVLSQGAGKASHLLGSPSKGLAKSHPNDILWWLNIHQRWQVQFLGQCRYSCSLSMLCNLHRIILLSVVETFSVMALLLLQGLFHLWITWCWPWSEKIYRQDRGLVWGKYWMDYLRHACAECALNHR